MGDLDDYEKGGVNPPLTTVERKAMQKEGGIKGNLKC